jgi:hypothetical protein
VDGPQPQSGDRRGILAADTSPEAERLQIEAWRRMSPAEKAPVTSGLTRAVRASAFAGIRQRHPGASERECFLCFALLTLVPELACRAYPEARALAQP